MHILLVEDDEELIKRLDAEISAMPQVEGLVTARSRDAAQQLIFDQFFDLVILDLKIPTRDHELDTDTVHGQAVFRHCRQAAPGTPILILTGSRAERFIPELLKENNQIDVWGQGSKMPTVQFLAKLDLDQFPENIIRMSQAVRAVEDVEIERVGDGIELDVGKSRILRIFARHWEGATCIISSISGGLSSSGVFRIKVLDAAGTDRMLAIGKLDQLEAVEAELNKYHRHINRLVPEATPRLVRALIYGGKDQGGIFYGLTPNFDRTLFQVSDVAEQIESLVAELGRRLDRWADNVPTRQMTVREIRRRLVSDHHAASLIDKFEIRLPPDFEDRRLPVVWRCIHGDLHGENVLVDSEGNTQVIDFGDVGDGPGALDPVTLELSILFHPNGPARGSEWPTEEAADNWGDLGKYAAKSSYESYVTACRSWATRLGSRNREVAASAYSYLLRQLRYDDTDKELACQLITGALKLFQST